MQAIQYHIIHCTGTPEGKALSAEEVIHMHTAPPPLGRGWSTPGYNVLIHLDGTVSVLVPFDDDQVVDAWEIANGVKGLNAVSRHYAYVGGMNIQNKLPKDTRTEKQLFTLIQLIVDSIDQNEHALWAGHYQFDDNKACPSFNIPLWLRQIGIPEKNIFLGD